MHLSPTPTSTPQKQQFGITSVHTFWWSDLKLFTENLRWGFRLQSNSIDHLLRYQDACFLNTHTHRHTHTHTLSLFLSFFLHTMFFSQTTEQCTWGGFFLLDGDANNKCLWNLCYFEGEILKCWIDKKCFILIQVFNHLQLDMRFSMNCIIFKIVRKMNKISTCHPLVTKDPLSIIKLELFQWIIRKRSFWKRAERWMARTGTTLSTWGQW